MAIAARLTAMASVTAHCHQNASIGRYQARNCVLAPAAEEDYPRICRLLPRCDAIMSFEPIISSSAEDPAEGLARLGAVLVESGAIDRRTLDRARRVAAETGGRLDHVLTQLGLVSERGLAEALAQLIGAPLVAVADYPDTPLFLDRLKVKFLRRVRALPIAADRRSRYPGDGRSARRLYPQRGRGGARPPRGGRGRGPDRARSRV